MAGYLLVLPRGENEHRAARRGIVDGIACGSISACVEPDTDPGQAAAYRSACFPIIFSNAAAVAGNAGPAGVDHHGIGEDHSEHVLGNMNLFRMAAYVLRVWLPAVGLHTLQIENGKRPALELRTQQ
jgi:hypothetical protein